MKSRETEYKEIFIAEAQEEFDAMNQHITELEKNPSDEKIVGEIFRLLHNLKANAKAMGYLNISDFSHKLENVFGALRNKDIKFSGKIVTVLFEAIDYLGVMLEHLDDPEKSKTDERIEQNLEKILSDLSDANIEVAQSTRQYHTSQNISISEMIYIPIRRLDNLLNLVGELIIDRDRINSISKDSFNNELKSVSAHLYRITSAIQRTVMEARLVNIGYLFNKFPRIVRDIALIENKPINLQITGQDIQIDRNILQILTDSLLHIVRNSITHGIESPEERKKNKKPEIGSLTLSAHSDKDTVLIQIHDDGKGIDPEAVRKYAVARQFISQDKASQLSEKEILSFIFEPGFSLSKQVTEFSGRGVGLDIVKNDLDALGGRIRVDSEKNKGTTFSLYVPTSIAVKGALLFDVAGSHFAIPLIHTDSVHTVPVSDIHKVGEALVADLKGETIPLLNLHYLFYGFLPESKQAWEVEDVVIINYNNRKIGLIVDKLQRQQDIVVKTLQRPVDQVDLFGGVTLLGDGAVCLVLDVPSLAKKFILKTKEIHPGSIV